MSIKTKIFNLLRSILKIYFLEKWLRSKTIGKGPSNFFYKITPNNYQYRKNTIRKFNYKGVWLKVDIRDYVGHYLYFGFKDQAHEKLISLIQPNFCVLDIGTNVGSTLLQFANKVRGNGKVFGFEPDLINFNACMENIRLNSFNNIEVTNIGLGNETGEFNLVVDTETNRGGNRISYESNPQKETTNIKVKKLDNWIKNKKIEKIDLIKIDVEGFETNVIKGGLNTIKKHMPILFIELDDTNLKRIKSNAKELIKFLETLNYNIINAENNNRITSSDEFTNCHFDIICKPK